jgi:hypothetical protein
MKNYFTCIVIICSIPGCAAAMPDASLTSLNTIEPPLIEKNVCVSGYAIANERVYLYSNNKEDGKFSAALVPIRKSDSIKISSYSGKHVRVCGEMEVDRECWSSSLVCTPYSRPIYLKVLRYIEPLRE